MIEYSLVISKNITLLLNIIYTLLLSGCFSRRQIIHEEEIEHAELEDIKLEEKVEIEEERTDDCQRLDQKINYIEEEIIQAEGKQDNIPIYRSDKWNMPFKIGVEVEAKYNMSLINSYDNDRNVLASRSGRVIYVGRDTSALNEGRMLYSVILQHKINNQKWLSSYGRLQKLFVKHKQFVNPDTILGLSCVNEPITMAIFKFDESQKKTYVKIKDVIENTNE